MTYFHKYFKIGCAVNSYYPAISFQGSRNGWPGRRGEDLFEN